MAFHSALPGVSFSLFNEAAPSFRLCHLCCHLIRESLALPPRVRYCPPLPRNHHGFELQNRTIKRHTVPASWLEWVGMPLSELPSTCSWGSGRQWSLSLSQWVAEMLAVCPPERTILGRVQGLESLGKGWDPTVGSEEIRSKCLYAKYF